MVCMPSRHYRDYFFYSSAVNQLCPQGQGKHCVSSEGADPQSAADDFRPGPLMTFKERAAGLAARL